MAPRYAISESESDPDAEEAPAAPSGKTLEKALRDAVAAVYKSKKMEELTIKRIRLAAATKLGLDEGFFKGSEWKGRSEQVIKDEVVGPSIGTNLRLTAMERPRVYGLICRAGLTRCPSVSRKYKTKQLRSQSGTRMRMKRTALRSPRRRRNLLGARNPQAVRRHESAERTPPRNPRTKPVDLQVSKT